MGCDIHIAFEHLNVEKNKWVSMLDDPEVYYYGDHYYGAHTNTSPDISTLTMNEDYEYSYNYPWSYLPRDYHLFCTLSGVRCGYADEEEHSGEANGLPDDITSKTQAWIDCHAGGDHSFTHMPFNEFIDAYIFHNTISYEDALNFFGIDPVTYFALGNSTDNIRVIIGYDS